MLVDSVVMPEIMDLEVVMIICESAHASCNSVKMTRKLQLKRADYFLGYWWFRCCVTR